jgi:hypothetical protein
VGDDATLSWSASTDSETAQPSLTYNLRVGSTPGAGDVMPPMSDLATGWREVPSMGNVQHNTSWTVKGLAPGTYFWSVQAVDAALAGSPWAMEEPFTIDPNTDPVLTPVSSPQAAAEHFVFEIDLEATDADLPPQVLTFGMLNAPPGATLDPATGLFSFTPDETQGGQSYTVTFTVDDCAGGSDSQDVQIDVTESDTGEGDVDKDGDVDAVDIAIIAFHFGLGAGACPDADLDDSGTIGGGDFARVIANWGNHYDN